MSVSKKTVLNYLIMFAIMAVIGICPPVASITPLGMKIIGVFIGVIYGWIMIDIVPVSMIGFVCLALTDYDTLTNLIGTGLSNSIAITILLSVIFAGVVAKTRCMDVVSKFMLTSKFAQKDPWNLVLAIFILAAIGHVCDMMYATIFLLWALVIKLADYCGYEHKSPFVTYMITMISVIAVSTGLIFPWKPQILFFSSMYDPTFFVKFSYAKYMLLATVYLVVFIISMILIAKYIFKMDISKFRLDEETIKEYEAMTIEPIQKFGLIGVLLFALIMFSSSLLPSGSVAATMFNKFGLAGVIFVFIMAFSFLKDSDGKPLLNFETVHDSIPWGVMWLVWFVTPLTAAMQSDGCGIIATIGETFLPMFSGMNVFVFMIVAMVFIGILTQILNNIVLAAIFMPVCYSIASVFGQQYIFILFIILVLTLNCDATTPAGSMSGAMCHGHSEVSKKYVYLFGTLACVVTMLICAVVLTPLGMLIC